jgi:hypothetical protein
MLPALRKSLRSMLANLSSSVKKIALSVLSGHLLRHRRPTPRVRWPPAASGIGLRQPAHVAILEGAAACPFYHFADGLLLGCGNTTWRRQELVAKLGTNVIWREVDFSCGPVKAVIPVPPWRDGNDCAPNDTITRSRLNLEPAADRLLLTAGLVTRPFPPRVS